jgi:two-component system sensor histidine kinase CpxA
MFGKVFIAFWASSLAVVFAVGMVSLLLGARPLLFLWLTQSLDSYAQTAAELYEHGGVTALNHFLDDIRIGSGIDGAFLDRQGKNLGSQALPAHTQDVQSQARSSGQTAYDRHNWTAAVAVSGRQGRYIFVAHVQPWRRRTLAFNSQLEFSPLSMLARTVGGLLVATLLCLFMARYLTRPIRTLQAVTRRIAAGDLAARATPLLGNRHDELSELALDFDLMAEKVHTLIERQSTLLRDISHELRSPLARLTLSSELVRRGDTGAASRMDDDIHRLEQLISELLTLSRIEASDQATRKDVVNIGHMIRQVLLDAEFEGQPAHKDLIHTGQSDLAVVGDPNLLQRCIDNVIRNAVRYTPPNTTIEVNLNREDSPGAASAAVIRIIDEGPGVPAEALPHLFEPFFRVSAARSHQDGGTGLGLSISQRIVALHGGRIEAANRPEGGLEVVISLPLASTALASDLMHEA